MKYIVQKGDTLSALALRFYGNAREWPQLWDRNRAVIEAAQRLEARQLRHMTGPNWIFPRTMLEVPNQSGGRRG